MGYNWATINSTPWRRFTNTLIPNTRTQIIERYKKRQPNHAVDHKQNDLSTITDTPWLQVTVCAVRQWKWLIDWLIGVLRHVTSTQDRSICANLPGGLLAQALRICIAEQFIYNSATTWKQIFFQTMSSPLTDLRMRQDAPLCIIWTVFFTGSGVWWNNIESSMADRDNGVHVTDRR